MTELPLLSGLTSVLLMKVPGAGVLEELITDRRPHYEPHIRRSDAHLPGPAKRG